MGLADDGGSRFAAYVEGLASVIGHKDREGPLRDYCLGLMMPCERKSVEPLAAVTAPARAAAQHQSLLHFIGSGGWSDERVLAKVREMVLPQIEQHGAISAWIIDDTSFPKQGRHSVGVARQYCGQLGKQDWVAAAKIAPDRLDRIERDMGARADERLRIIEFLKPAESNIRGFEAGLKAAARASAAPNSAAPSKRIHAGARRLRSLEAEVTGAFPLEAAELAVEGVRRLHLGLDEICQILPVPLARRLLAAAENREWLRNLHIAMELETTSISGYLRLWGLAKLRAFRPWTHRYQEEQRAIEDWLALTAEAARHSAALALEVVECARLLKGYGDTLRRGRSNFALIEARVIRPVLAGQIPLATGTDAIASARAAALIDPDGAGLSACLAEIDRPTEFRVAAE